jgi:hypothetical protein
MKTITVALIICAHMVLSAREVPWGLCVILGLCLLFEPPYIFTDKGTEKDEGQP